MKMPRPSLIVVAFFVYALKQNHGSIKLSLFLSLLIRFPEEMKNQFHVRLELVAITTHTGLTY